jgi:very-short-patch-repair endonuclease
MVDIAEIVHGLGGMAHKRQLAGRGARDIDLTRAVRHGAVTRVRRGWYSTLPNHRPEVRAVRVGGRLTGLSAISAAGGWVLESSVLHVSVHHNAARLRAPGNPVASFGPARRRNVRVYWDSARVGRSGTTTRVGLLDALERVVLDEPLEVAVAAIDWALHTRQLDSTDLDELLHRLPLRKRGIGDWVDASCESLPESLARTRLRLRGHRVTTQVRVGGSQRIDLVVDGTVALETDGEQYHRDRFHADRAKDITMTIAGYHGVRATAMMVFRDWDRVLSAISEALLRRGVAIPSPLSAPGSRARAPGFVIRLPA